MYKREKTVHVISRRRRATLISLGLIGLSFLIWLDRSRSVDRRPSPDNNSAVGRAADIERYHARTFAVVKIVDGDTLDIDIPDGQAEHTRIRLWGVDTPETHGAGGVAYFGPEATRSATALLSGQNIIVFLDPDNDTRGYYGRLLAYVQLPDGRFLNEVLLKEGLAYADVRFRHSYYNKYKQLEAVARSQKKGLWEHVTREQLPNWLQERKPTLLKSQ